jgi:putative NADH-flavin reductase
MVSSSKEQEMKLIVFGATGTVGRHLVGQALTQGHQVTAFARGASALKLAHKNLNRQPGDVLDRAEVSVAVQGHDAALIALGAGRKGMVRAVGTKHVIDAMVQRGVRRLVCQTTLGLGDSRALLNFFWKRIMFGLLLRDAYADHETQEAIIKESDLDWIIVRPGAFTDGPATGVYKHGFPPTDQTLSLKISRADLANFMLRQLTDDSYLHRSPGLSY